MLINTIISTQNVSTTTQPLQGWTSEVQGRGTWSVISSCLSTTFLCTWVVIHPRIDSRPSFRRLHKLALLIKTCIAPELIAVESVQEWAQARRILKKCSSATNGEFKLIHAFYIGMFGVRYRLAELKRSRGSDTKYHSKSKVLWPMQYVFLIENGLVSWAEREQFGLCEKSIKDKSNADSAAKLIAILGVAKFTIECIWRMCSHLPLAPLEAMTLGYIPLFALS